MWSFELDGTAFGSVDNLECVGGGGVVRCPFSGYSTGVRYRCIKPSAHSRCRCIEHPAGEVPQVALSQASVIMGAIPSALLLLLLYI